MLIWCLHVYLLKKIKNTPSSRDRYFRKNNTILFKRESVDIGEVILNATIAKYKKGHLKIFQKLSLKYVYKYVWVE